MKICIFFVLLIFFLIRSVSAQDSDTFPDKCGYDPVLSKQMLKVLGDGWGYSYDSLLIDLPKWGSSPFVNIDSIGQSVQQRTLWLLTISDTLQSESPKKRISIHARTHPGEVQGWWVTNQIINILLAESELALALRKNCIFNIIPMYNPDGVELGFPRENANNIDIESNWGAVNPEKEVVAIRSFFEYLMFTGSPIEVALNMHSAYACKRYFVYHHENGTSGLYTELEKEFIGGVKSYWEDGFEPWNHFVSWTSGTPDRYPESWFWNNYQENVMALTYEDMNCATAGNYHKTAESILNGVADYLDIDKTPSQIEDQITGNKPKKFDLISVYPNPVNKDKPTHIRLALQKTETADISLYDILGRKILTIKNGFLNSGISTFSFDNNLLSKGVYYIRYSGNQKIEAKKFIVLK